MHMRAILAVLLPIAVPCIAAEPTYTLTQGDWTLAVSDTGEINRVSDKAGRQLVADVGVPHLAVSVNKPLASLDRQLDCTHPVSAHKTDHSIVFDYGGPKDIGLRLRYEIAFENCAGWPTIRRQITLLPAEPPFKEQTHVRVGRIFLPSGAVAAVAPGQDGLLKRITDKSVLGYLLTSPSPAGASIQQLALPFISTSDAKEQLRITHIADPLFTTVFDVQDTSARTPRLLLQWSAPCEQVPLTEPFTRTIWTVIHDGPTERALDAWYATALADVPPGPAWLHDIAMQDYDYLSHGGKGWFEDIDAAEKLVAKADRGKVLFTLHGWYDVLGRYTFDAKTGKLDNEWIAFPNAANVKDKFPTSEAVKMSKADMHRRLRYAKDRGFRTCLYFADGLTACEGAKMFADDKLLSWGGWEGPDTVGKPYTQNPAHPDVYRWYIDYLKALLAEYGPDIDAIVWDETFMIRVGMTTPPKFSKPAYLAPVFMRLIEELTQITTAYRKDLAFLTSDLQGVSSDDEKTNWLDVPPYAIMSHGTYQDSHCSPSCWPYGIFANYRNVLWSCNWNAVTHFDYTQFGVKHYGVPVAVSNGWLDDKGLAELTEAERAAFIDLFNQRKDKPQRLQWLTDPAPRLAPAPAK